LSRPKGSKNTPIDSKKMESESDIELPDEVVLQIKKKVADEVTKDIPYVVCFGNTISELMTEVDRAMMFFYVCQGGVSVTNYRGLDGNIVMVYCQAMVRREG
jgi:hypothetical protein